ncbi:regulator of chromosome condensation (RCC1) protein, putative (macronuclear) [Tetrahymena thermophila SB210]|uniref:Regulator of chromosome condensation (RCC1) protein, putative n=1 Tax=Tetrahymena thermophila (strain SB210) TaxID=312017 RepID=Q228R6_TETTS|nr:regulator of chromosome condensation (RCC1) protein, putative [Tetrahymena thermophila SB210]EAR81783.2 regulator of chromosome condensation (RCC1) protein, putative [Tetrahymena thermophila SB210]|eukprot:XP_001029446.2 regulator of chromosome condensation (RCC1) protein, putative [Tetrahymena thermophila SB210]
MDKETVDKVSLVLEGQYVWGTAFFGYFDEPQFIQADGIFWKGFTQENNFICLTDDQGKAYSWGQNINEELALGLYPSHQQQAYPQEIQINMEDKYVKKIECGQHFSFAVLSNLQNIVNNLMLAEQINQFSQQIQKFQSDYPSVLNKNQIQENNQENQFNFNTNNYQQTDQIQQKRQVSTVALARIFYKQIHQKNKIKFSIEAQELAQVIAKMDNNKKIQQKKNLRLNTQGNNALIERCETEQVKQMSNKNQGVIKLDQILPNYFTNHRVLTESADFSVNNINRFQSNQQVNVVSQSIPGNFKLEAMQNQNILNLSEIAFNQSEVLKENNSNLQNNCQLQNEQMTWLKDVFDKTSQSFYQQQKQINSQIQYSQNKIDHLQQQNYSFVGKIQDIQLKYYFIQKKLEQSQQENKSLKKQLSEEKNKNVKLQIRVDHLTKKSKSLQKKNELLLLEIDMNKKTYEMKCEALLKQIYNYQSLETIQDKGNQQQLNQINQQYETLLENFITINENGQNNNALDTSYSQVKNMQTFADPVDDKQNIQMNNQFVKQENNSKLSSQFQSSKVSVSQDFINLIHNNEQYQNNQYNIIDMKDLQIQINPSSPFSNSNASKKLTMKLNQLSLINRNNQPYQINEDL